MKKPTLFVVILTLLAACALPALAQKKVTGQPDVLVIIAAGENGDDQIGLTYPGVISRAQAMRDVQAVKTATGLAVRDVKITTDTAPIKSATVKMTSVEMTVPHAFSAVPRAFSVEPLVSALRNYPHIALTYFAPEGFTFEGLREWQDDHVRITLDQRGTVYTYQVFVRDPRFRKLNLPLHQPPMSEMRTVRQNQPSGQRNGAIFGVALAALAVGALVYLLAARRAQ